MMNLRLYFCVLLAGTLLILGSCKKEGGGTRSGLPPDITISNCNANPYTFTVKDGRSVDWEVGPGDQHDYTIQFSDASEPTNNPFKVKHGVSNTAHPMKGHNKCVPSPAGHGEFDCKYTLTRDDGPCTDPIIHIVPNQ